TGSTTASPTGTSTTGSPTASKVCYPEVILEEEDFEDNESSDSWVGGTLYDSEVGSQLLGLLGQGNSEVSKEFDIPLLSDGSQPTEASSVTVEFTLYQVGDWSPTDSVFVQVNDVRIELGDMDDGSDSEPDSGEEGGITWERTTTQQGISVIDEDSNEENPTDKKHVVLLTIPSDVLEDNKLTLEFRTLTSNPISEQSSGIDDLVITGFYVCEKTLSPSAVTASPTGTSTTSSPPEPSTTPGPTSGHCNSWSHTHYNNSWTPLALQLASPTGTSTTGSTYRFQGLLPRSYHWKKRL
ncbi:expressed unknown protein (Partial), partial [Seminavis robusta]